MISAFANRNRRIGWAFERTRIPTGSRGCVGKRDATLHFLRLLRLLYDVSSDSMPELHHPTFIYIYLRRQCVEKPLQGFGIVSFLLVSPAFMNGPLPKNDLQPRQARD